VSKLNRNALAEAEGNLELARRIWRDLSGGNSDHSGVSIEIVGPYLLVSDTQDVWLTTTEEYQDALDSIVKNAANGEYDSENESEAYSDLCGECPAMFSVIGQGEYNGRIPELIERISACVSESEVEEICERIGVSQHAQQE
jgi:hypothetical protein